MNKKNEAEALLPLGRAALLRSFCYTAMQHAPPPEKRLGIIAMIEPL